MQVLYTTLFYLALPLVLMRMLWRSRSNPGYRRGLAQRLGFSDIRGPFDLWVHAVSVGEARAAQTLLESLRSERPDLRVLLTTTTPTGAEIGHSRPQLRDAQCYMPWDLPDAVARFLKRSQPRLAVMMETEMWPNSFRALQRRGIGLIIANGRLSPGSFRGYQRVAGLTRRVLSQVTLIAAQSQDDADRFRGLGARAEQLHVTGNLKFDLTAPADHSAQVARLESETGFAAGPRTLLAASLHPGEDGVLIEAFTTLRAEFSDARLVIVPRHPERFEGMSRAAVASGFVSRRRSAGKHGGTEILIGDSVGEMMAYLGLGDLVFIGGSLIPHGGQNVLEPALLGKPVLCGPHMFNFIEPVAVLEAAGGLRKLQEQESLSEVVAGLWRAPEALKLMGQAGKTVMEKNRGAAARLSRIILEQLPGS